MADKNEILKRAKKRVKARKGFYAHLASFIAVGIFFFLMNMATLGEEPNLWFFFPMLPWMVGLLIHYLRVFGFPVTGALSEEWEAREMYKAIRHERMKEGLPPDPDEAEEAFYPPASQDLELPDLKKQKDPLTRWDDKDIV
ncbi:MAG: 2TM domain-containing protein [Haliscomenobacter sp.]|nr:2TM domain-containing protein [Haliscomenobacter sp.]